jgi:hypothetical protein
MASRSQILPRGIHQIRAPLHLADQCVVEQVLGLGMEWRMGGDDIANAHHRFDVSMVGKAQLSLNTFREPMAIRVGSLDGLTSMFCRHCIAAKDSSVAPFARKSRNPKSLTNRAGRGLPNSLLDKDSPIHARKRRVSCPHERVQDGGAG